MFAGFFAQFNFLAWIVSGIVYSLIGSIWFSGIFGKTWGKEMAKHGIKIKKPSSKEMGTKVFYTFLFNLFIAFGVALFVYGMGAMTVMDGINLGLILGLFFSAGAMGISYLWESRSWKLSLIDIGYPILGIIASSIILTVWQ
jgi:hypothetical protein